jgi:hypothetical protein
MRNQEGTINPRWSLFPGYRFTRLLRSLRSSIVALRQNYNALNEALPPCFDGPLRNGVRDNFRYFSTGLSLLGNNRGNLGPGSVTAPSSENSFSNTIGLILAERFIRSWHAGCTETEP